MRVDILHEILIIAGTGFVSLLIWRARVAPVGRRRSADELPAERGEVDEAVIGESGALLTQGVRRAAEIDAFKRRLEPASHAHREP
jgi:hypothetical protein